MEFVIDGVVIISAVLGFVVGTIITFYVFNKKDSLAMEMIQACDDVMNEYGHIIKAEDPILYEKCMDTIKCMKSMASDGTSFIEFIKFVSSSYKLFKHVIEFYNLGESIDKKICEIKK